MREFKNVNVTITDSVSNWRVSGMSAHELADIFESVDNTVIREALALVNTRNKNRIIGIAQCIHGVLYASYFKLSKYWGKDDE